MLVLEASAFGRAGSIPAGGTMKQLKTKELLEIKKAINDREVPEETWPLFDRLFELHNENRRRATDLAWELEEFHEAQKPIG